MNKGRIKESLSIPPPRAARTWDGKNSRPTVPTGHQQNGTVTSTLGALPSNPLGALINESALTPVECLLNHRQARFAQTVLSARKGAVPRISYGGEERHLRTATRLGEGDDDVEARHAEEGRKFQGAVVITEGKNPKEAEEMAKAAALWTDNKNTAWTDGSRLENKERDTQWCGTPPNIQRTVRSTAQTAKRTVDGGRHSTTHTRVAEERAAHGTRALETRPHHPLGSPTDRGGIPSRDKQRSFRRSIICHLPSSHAVRKTARTRPRIYHICRLAGSDEVVSDRPPMPRTRNRAGHYPAE